jgi:Ran GTPase-activating protein (RanGAP) involved in mRNA processing and transport
MLSEKDSVITESSNRTDLTIEGNGIYRNSNLGSDKVRRKRIRQWLRRNPDAEIKTLDLSGNNLTNKKVRLILEELPENGHCKTLNLSNNKLTKSANAMCCVSRNINLQELNLFSNLLDDEIADAFGFSIMLNERLTKINIGNNKFTCVGMGYLLDSFADRNNLVEIHISHSKIDNKGHIEFIKNILEKNETLTTLNLAECALNGHFANAVLEAAISHSSLQVLDLRSNKFTYLNPVLLSNLFKQNTTLTSINLSETKLTRECIRNLALAYKDRNANCKIQLILSDTAHERFHDVLKMMQNAAQLQEASNNNNQDNNNQDNKDNKDNKDDRNTFKRRKI